ncbi:hypothetical protein H2201_001860 [Coniosporium apollinis]|uniref:Zn(2)-C6 fungal-type domain-containing protein n=1 Tax=Coniosporium apollinis TaxID=61459 RepID=A0ABQ9P0C7_9PEZI|nr:hypothetical protein H2201_001860 [Coniosporium apollinis]
MAEIAKAKRKANSANTDSVNTAPAPTKRQRVSRACDQCRSAREKCDGIQPVCFTCASSNRDCSYTVNPKKRGIQPGYIRTLELALAWVFGNLSGSEQALAAVLSDNGSAGQSVLVGKDTDGSYKLHRKWRKSTVCKEIERLLSGNEVKEPGAQQNNNGKFSADEEEDGANGEHDTTMLTPSSAGVPIKDPNDLQDRERSTVGSAHPSRNQYASDLDHTTAGAESRHGAGLLNTSSTSAIFTNLQNPFTNRAETAHGTHEVFGRFRYPSSSYVSGSLGAQSTAPYTGIGSVSNPVRPTDTSSGLSGINTRHLPLEEIATGTKRAALKLPASLWRLFDVYFGYTHCWFPIAEKHDVMKISYSYPEEGLDLTAGSIDSGAHAELWSILALASFQDVSLSSGEAMSDTKASDIYDIARSLIPTEEGSFQIGHVKALLLLSLVNMGSTNDDIAWLLVGQAARIAILLGLDKSETTTTTSTPAAKHQHVFLGCFVVDSMISARLGRSPLISRKQVHDIGLLPEEGLEEWQPWVGCQGFGVGQDMKLRSPVHALSTFNRMVRLMLAVHEATSPEGANVLQPVDLEYDTLSSPGRKSFQLPGNGYDVFSKQSQSTAFPAGKRGGGRHQEHSSQTRSLSSIYQEIIAETGEERGSMKAATTPPALILQIASECAAQAFEVAHSNIDGQLSHRLKRYAEAFGIAGMPPIFHTLLSLVRTVSPGSSMLNGERDHLAAFDNVICGMWDRKRARGGIGEVEARHDNPHHVTAAVSKEYTPASLSNILPTPTSLNIGSTQNFSPILPRQQSHADIMVPTTPWQPLTNLNYFTPKISQAALDAQNDQSGGYDGAPLERFASAGSVDLDALFDELASLDGADRQDNQPQFMQNLGFAPNIDLNDFLTSDYGQFDPLLSVYAQQSAIGPSAMDQDVPFEEG